MHVFFGVPRYGDGKVFFVAAVSVVSHLFLIEGFFVFTKYQFHQKHSCDVVCFSNHRAARSSSWSCVRAAVSSTSLTIRKTRLGWKRRSFFEFCTILVSVFRCGMSFENAFSRTTDVQIFPNFLTFGNHQKFPDLT